MKIGHVFPDLLRGLGTAASVEDGLRLMVRRLVRLTGAEGGALRFQPPRGGSNSSAPASAPLSRSRRCSATSSPAGTEVAVLSEVRRSATTCAIFMPS